MYKYVHPKHNWITEYYEKWEMRKPRTWKDGLYIETGPWVQQLLFDALILISEKKNGIEVRAQTSIGILWLYVNVTIDANSCPLGLCKEIVEEICRTWPTN